MNKKLILENQYLLNPHLDGDPFFLEGGPVGIFLSHGYTATAAEVRLVAERFHKQGYPGLPLKGLVQFLRFQAVTRKRLSEITQPVLTFQGRQDTTVAPEAGKMIMDGISSKIKEHHWIEKSSRVIVLDVELEQVAALSLQFIEVNL